MTDRHHDLVIIGTGSGNTIIGPEHDHLDIAIVEKDLFGGTCLNVGCIPTKMFVYPADVIGAAEHAGGLGVHIDAARVDWPAIRDRIFARIDPIPPAGEAFRRGLDNVTVYKDQARFTGAKHLELESGVRISADQIVVAAGGRARLHDVPGLDVIDPAAGVHTSDTIMRLDELPKRLAVIGAGFVAAEFVHVFTSFGVDVCWLQRSARALGHEDDLISTAYTSLAVLRGGLQVNTQVRRAQRTGDSWLLCSEGPDGDREDEVDAVLIAVGRVPNTDLLDATAAGLELHPDGRIVVDEYQRTNVPGIFALGDISSDYQLKHVANHEARVVAHNIVHPDDLIASDHRFVPHAVFGHPQIAAFGATERDLQERGTPYHVKVQPYGDVAYGWAMEDQTGICKVLATPEGDILGAHIMGYQASVVIQPLIQAASFGQRASDVASGQYWIHPAITEVVENALLGLAPPA